MNRMVRSAVAVTGKTIATATNKFLSILTSQDCGSTQRVSCFMEKWLRKIVCEMRHYIIVLRLVIAGR
jgi:hypothetical protein